ncbi:26S proteasome non-atpase regulatory [Musa troglodytarum]|uniref:26S proteasome non-atpase regulatory n=1 Tax=Musa troglodytarum TaxID=320322 RepID=A0A9E7F2G0_9LILI|nr:26S proteasome non-atpase regulatory [Musa troglodytarum]
MTYELGTPLASEVPSDASFLKKLVGIHSGYYRYRRWVLDNFTQQCPFGQGADNRVLKREMESGYDPGSSLQLNYKNKRLVPRIGLLGRKQSRVLARLTMYFVVGAAKRRRHLLCRIPFHFDHALDEDLQYSNFFQTTTPHHQHHITFLPPTQPTSDLILPAPLHHHLPRPWVPLLTTQPVLPFVHLSSAHITSSPLHHNTLLLSVQCHTMCIHSAPLFQSPGLASRPTSVVCWTKRNGKNLPMLKGLQSGSNAVHRIKHELEQKFSNRTAPSSFRTLRKHLECPTSTSAPISEARTALLVTLLQPLPTGSTTALAFEPLIQRGRRPSLHRTKQFNEMPPPELEAPEAPRIVGTPRTPAHEPEVRGGAASVIGVGDQEVKEATEELIDGPQDGIQPQEMSRESPRMASRPPSSSEPISPLFVLARWDAAEKVGAAVESMYMARLSSVYWSKKGLDCLADI